MEAAKIIIAAEEKYLNLLSVFFATKWGKTSLWSHDLDHHLRVWHYARILLEISMKKYRPHDKKLPEKLIIASMLHDIGMAKDFGENHGKISRETAREFLVTNGISEPDMADVLEAIEVHDKKDNINNDISGLATLLTTADDLDAFGYVGIFRYLEIYNIRGIDMNEIHSRISENATLRFRNFISRFGSEKDLVTFHEKRYNILNDFFNIQISNQSKIPGSDFYNLFAMTHRSVEDKLPTSLICNGLYKDFEGKSEGELLRGLSSELEIFNQ